MPLHIMEVIADVLDLEWTFYFSSGNGKLISQQNEIVRRLELQKQIWQMW